MNKTHATPPGTGRGLARLMLLCRLVAGGIYIAGGLIPFTHWADLPIPSPWAGYFLDALVDSDILKVSKAMEIIFGLGLVLNLWVPLSLAMLAPVLFFIAWVDLYMDPFPLGVLAVCVLVICHLFLMYMYRDCYRPMLERKVKP